MLLLISKKRSVPLILKKEEALLRRLPDSHPQYPAISASLARRRAGYKGEQSLDYHLNQLDRTSHIFHDLRFCIDSLFFQMDTLLLTPYFILIIEVKNISGTLYFDTDFNQMIRSTPEKEEGFRSPLTQAASQKNHLFDFLSVHGFASLPIEYVITISHPSTIIKANDPAIADTVIHAEDLSEKIKKLTKKHAEKRLTTQELQRLTQLLIKSDIPLNPNILQKYQIPSTALRTGVQCPDCSYIPMERAKRKWQCRACGTTSVSAHKQAIEDYLLLLSPIISNQECRKFLHHSSTSTIKRYLADSGLKRKGRGKKTIYHQ